MSTAKSLTSNSDIRCATDSRHLTSLLPYFTSLLVDRSCAVLIYTTWSEPGYNTIAHPAADHVYPSRRAILSVSLSLLSPCRRSVLGQVTTMAFCTREDRIGRLCLRRPFEIQIESQRSRSKTSSSRLRILERWVERKA